MKKIMNKINEFKKARELNEDGFSLIELVVAVGILAILSVVGVVAYSQITDNARQTAVNAAASEIFTAATAKEATGNTNTGAEEAAREWLKSAEEGSFTVFVDEATNSIKVVSKAGNKTGVKGTLGEAAITTPVSAA